LIKLKQKFLHELIHAFERYQYFKKQKNVPLNLIHKS